MNTDIKLSAASAPVEVLHAVFATLGSGRISDALDHFAEHFTFNDRALALEFTNKERLREFFQKSRDYFPDTAVEVISDFGCGDYAVAEWKLTATQSYFVPPLRELFAALGVTIARIENGKVKHWTDYYDEKTSRRLSLAAYFTYWVAY
jgi:hypothetical protein